MHANAVTDSASIINAARPATTVFFKFFMFFFIIEYTFLLWLFFCALLPPARPFGPPAVSLFRASNNPSAYGILSGTQMNLWEMFLAPVTHTAPGNSSGTQHALQKTPPAHSIPYRKALSARNIPYRKLLSQTRITRHARHRNIPANSPPYERQSPPYAAFPQAPLSSAACHDICRTPMHSMAIRLADSPFACRCGRLSA